jgi:hypothetical protein
MTVELNKDYDNISKELLNVKVLPEGISYILTNVNDMVNFDWNKLNLDIIKKYPHINNELIKVTREKSLQYNNVSIHCVFPYIQLFLPENYNFIKKEIISKWANNYKSKLQPIYHEDTFDIAWYSNSPEIDYNWAYTRLNNIKKINKTIDNYVELNSR